MEYLKDEKYRSLPRLRNVTDFTDLREQCRLFGKNTGLSHNEIVDESRQKFRGMLYDLGFQESTSSLQGYETYTRCWSGRTEFLTVMVSFTLGNNEKGGSFTGYRYVMGLTVMENTLSDHTYSADIMFSKQVSFDDLFDDVEEQRKVQARVEKSRSEEKAGIKSLAGIV